MTTVNIHNEMDKPAIIYTTHTKNQYSMGPNDTIWVPHTSGDIVAYDEKHIAIDKIFINVSDFETEYGSIWRALPLFNHITLPIKLNISGKFEILKNKSNP
ncbi:hypothetical protein [Desulforegula conservatrix]|uniref:hypothetical protein n=1 Tax=Desulforegula conservatrix TaxID=153026 RepID=UPI0012EC27E2|nr:hypothetical protein [Desulforegula conservatrix]